MKKTTAAVVASVSLLVLAMLVLQVRLEWLAAKRSIGVVIEQGDADGLLVVSVAPEGPAAAGGVMAGDLLTAVDGRSVTGLLDYDRAAASLEPGEEAVYRLLRDEAVLTVRLWPGIEPPWVDLAINAVAVLGHLALALLVLMQGPGDLRARLLLLFSLAVAVELSMPMITTGLPAVTVAVTLAFLILSGFQLAVELHLSAVLVDEPGETPWLRYRRPLVSLFYVTGLLVAVSLVGLYVGEITGALSSGPFEQAFGLFNLVVLPLWAVGVVTLLGMAAATYREPVGRARAALVLQGVLPWAMLMLASLTIDLLGLTAPGWFDRVMPLALLCYPVAVFVAIFRYHLFDLRLVVRRGLVYTALSTTLVLFFYGAVGTGGALLSNLLGAGSVWVVGIATLILGLLFAPLRRLINRTIEWRLFPEREALNRRLRDLAGELPALGNLPSMGQRLVGGIKEIFACRSASLLLAQPRGGPLVPLATAGGRFDGSLLLPADDAGIELLAQTDQPLPIPRLEQEGSKLAAALGLLEAALAVPLMQSDRLVGVLLLGEKRGGSRYPADEIELLGLFSHHVASVLENARLFESATYDALTGLLRREAIMETLRKELERANRYKRPLTIGVADLDHFKPINDRHGHLAGDMLLKQVARALNDSLRSTDLVGRWGGEEFLVVLPETDLDGGWAVAEKTRRAVGAARVELADGEAASVTVSIGLASLDLESPERISIEELIEAADRALYDAKHEGRNRIVGARAEQSTASGMQHDQQGSPAS